jgi:hypothetical protein
MLPSRALTRSAPRRSGGPAGRGGTHHGPLGPKDRLRRG